MASQINISEALLLALYYKYTKTPKLKKCRNTLSFGCLARPAISHSSAIDRAIVQEGDIGTASLNFGEGGCGTAVDLAAYLSEFPEVSLRANIMIVN